MTVWPNFEKVKGILNLNKSPFDDIRPLLLGSAFMRKAAPNPLRRAMLSEYGWGDYETLEFVGDAVLELIITKMLFEMGSVINSPGFLTRSRILLVKNSTLQCFMLHKQLCKYVRPVLRGKDYTADHPDCADVFEAILGAVYYHLYYVKGMSDAIAITSRWLKETFDIHTIVNHILTSTRYECPPVNGGWSEWSRWKIQKDGSRTSTRRCDNPPPLFGGDECEGDSSRAQAPREGIRKSDRLSQT